jgi:CheY-like chemotaxis protein
MSAASKPRAKVEATVLVVDDDPIFRQLASTQLSALGYATREAEDGAAAWQALTNSRVSLVVVDLEMPNLNGIGLIESMRVRPSLQHVPVVVATSRTDAEAVQDVFEAGATSYLAKPVHWPTFASHVQCVLRVSKEAQQERSRRERAEASMRQAAGVAHALPDVLSRLRAALEKLDALVAEPSESSVSADLRARLDALRLEIGAATGLLAPGAVAEAPRPRAGDSSERLVPLSSFLAFVQVRVAKLSAESRVPVCISACPDNVYLSCAPDDLVDAMARVIANAIAFSAPGQSVVMEAQFNAEGGLAVSITDSGLGLRPSVLAACMPDAPTTAEEALLGGTQAEGLPGVRDVLARFGGQMSVRSKPRRGTCVQLTLPRDRVQLRD